MNYWNQLFDSVVYVAPLEHRVPPGWAAYDDSTRIQVVPFSVDRGHGLEQPVSGVLDIPRMVTALWNGCRKTDSLHLRCPGNIGLLGALLGRLLAKKRIAKYAGQWTRYAGEAWTVSLQRTLLGSRWWGAPTTVYTSTQSGPSHVIPFFSTAMTDHDLSLARDIALARTPKDNQRFRLLFVGRLSASKSVDVFLRAVSTMATPHAVTIVGDGPQREPLEKLASDLGLSSQVRFLGAIDQQETFEQYTSHDVLVLPSRTEGWPKVLTEAMAFGMVCVGTCEGLMPYMLAENRGFTFPFGDDSTLADILDAIARDYAQALDNAKQASAWAQQYSLEQLQQRLRQTMIDWWKLDERDLRPIG